MGAIPTVPLCIWLPGPASCLVQDPGLAWPQSKSDQLIDLLETESNKLVKLM